MALKYLENLVPPDAFPSRDVLTQLNPSDKVRVRATKHRL